LTDSASMLGMTHRQVSRIIEMFGNLDAIYRNLESIVPVHVRSRLEQCEKAIRHVYTLKKSKRARRVSLRTISADSLANLATAANRRQLKQYGFASLCGLLTITGESQSRSQANIRDRFSYRAVIDRDDFHRLKSLVCASKICAIDVESDSKDPRAA